MHAYYLEPECGRESLSHQLNKLRVSTPSIDTLHHRGRNNLPQPQTMSLNSQFTARKINPKRITC